MRPPARSHDSRVSPSTVAEGRSLAARLPDLLVEARQVAGTVAAGWHGRRRAGIGEDFWQFRPFGSGEPIRGIDWRRSARGETLFVREHELQNAHTVWLSVDLTSSMNYRSQPSLASKRDRAVVLALGLAELLSRAGERVGLAGDPSPVLSRLGAERIAEKLARVGTDARPPIGDVRRFNDVVVIGDFLAPPEEIAAFLKPVLGAGARAHLVVIVDPAEESFPFTGHVRFIDPETRASLVAGAAEDWRTEYLQRLRRHRAGLEALTATSGWSLLVHHTDRPAVEPLLDLHVRLALGSDTGATSDGGRI